jgi:DNA-binding transcriptional MerR regulator
MTDDPTSAERAKLYTAAEIAREFSLTAQGIRFYEEKGLVAPARVGKTRVFSYRDRARLILVQKLRGLGFSLEAIREYLSFYKSDATGAEQYRLGLKRITSRIHELEEKRRDIDEALAGLRTLESEAHERLEQALSAERRAGKSNGRGNRR